MSCAVFPDTRIRFPSAAETNAHRKKCSNVNTFGAFDDLVNAYEAGLFQLWNVPQMSLLLTNAHRKKNLLEREYIRGI